MQWKWKRIGFPFFTKRVKRVNPLAFAPRLGVALNHMTPKLLAAISMAATMALATGASAYHIQNHLDYETSQVNPEWWTSNLSVNSPVDVGTGEAKGLLGQVPVVGPLAQAIIPDANAEKGGILAGLTSCEHQDVVSDLLFPGSDLSGISSPGIGGLCYASPGYDDHGPAGVCTWSGFGSDPLGRSTGWAPNYESWTGSCETPEEYGGFLPAIPAGAIQRDWFKIQLCLTLACTSFAPVNTQYAGFNCETTTAVPQFHGAAANVRVPAAENHDYHQGGGTTGSAYQNVFIDGQDLYLHGGHIALFSEIAQSPGTFGTYKVTQSPNPLSLFPTPDLCHAPLPWYLQ
ncbi:MAG: hypothetical protein QOI63_1932 [Thermoplasmata archaeon]|jgi:hypothetical protein|nr:hypothetical protein [Thermoplasmata archaeon]